MQNAPIPYNKHNPDKDPNRPRYVIVSPDGLSCLMDPTTQKPFWTYLKSEAQIMLTSLEKDFQQRGEIMDLRSAIITLSNKHAERLNAGHNQLQKILPSNNGQNILG